MQEILLEGKLFLIVFDVPLIACGRERESASPRHDHKEGKNDDQVFVSLDPGHCLLNDEKSGFFRQGAERVSVVPMITRTFFPAGK